MTDSETEELQQQSDFILDYADWIDENRITLPPATTRVHYHVRLPPSLQRYAHEHPPPPQAYSSQQARNEDENILGTLPLDIEIFIFRKDAETQTKTFTKKVYKLAVTLQQITEKLCEYDFRQLESQSITLGRRYWKVKTFQEYHLLVEKAKFFRMSTREKDSTFWFTVRKITPTEDPISNEHIVRTHVNKIFDEIKTLTNIDVFSIRHVKSIQKLQESCNILQKFQLQYSKKSEE